MDKFAENIKNLLSACTPYAWLLPVIGLAIIGIAMAIPSEKTKEFAKKSLGWSNHWNNNICRMHIHWQLDIWKDFILI